MTAEEATDDERGAFALAAVALVAGAVVGLVCAAFRLALERADRARDALVSWAQGTGPLGAIALIAACAASVAIAAWLVRRFAPRASGSGIPEVEAALRRELPWVGFLIVPVKFAGGVLAIGAGLALGREGPCVQMGASLARRLGAICRRSARDVDVLLAAGAGAGLATAFNAPLAGAVFVLEELTRRFDVRTTLATLAASAGAIAAGRAVLGSSPEFVVDPLPFAEIGAFPAYLALGAAAGLAGVAYARAVLGALAVADRLARFPIEARAAAVGAVVGALACAWPSVVGGGDAITQRALSGGPAAAGLLGVLVVRFALGPASYAAGTPGGLFAPMLVVGAAGGRLFAVALAALAWRQNADAFAVVGTAAFFAAVVRAPVTGILLVTEMTGSFKLLLPMLVACFAAMVVPAWLRCEPVYDSLRARAVSRSGAPRVR